MYLGESVTFPQIVGFIMGLRHAQTTSHGFGFGTFNEFILQKFNLSIDKETEDGRWVEVIVEETATLSLTDACSRLSNLFSDWAKSERESQRQKEIGG